MGIRPRGNRMVDSNHLEVFERFVAAEYGYVSPQGRPLCWPVTPYWVPERGVLAIATGLAYPKKADYAKSHPRVALYFSDPRGSGLVDSPRLLVKGMATVLDQDLQANTDRYVRAIRAKFDAARLAVNSLTVKLLDFYLPRLWVEIEIASIEERPLGADPVSKSLPGVGMSRELNAGERAQVDQLASSFNEGVLTAIDARGYPDMTRLSIAPQGDGVISLDRAGPPGDATLTLHQHSLAGTRFHAYMLRGKIEDSQPDAFITQRLVGFFGNGSLFPLSVIPQIRSKRQSLKSELAKRGLSMPKLRIPTEER